MSARSAKVQAEYEKMRAARRKSAAAKRGDSAGGNTPTGERAGTPKRSAPAKAANNDASQPPKAHANAESGSQPSVASSSRSSKVDAEYKKMIEKRRAAKRSKTPPRETTKTAAPSAARSAAAAKARKAAAEKRRAKAQSDTQSETRPLPQPEPELPPTAGAVDSGAGAQSTPSVGQASASSSDAAGISEARKQSRKKPSKQELLADRKREIKNKLAKSKSKVSTQKPRDGGKAEVDAGKADKVGAGGESAQPDQPPPPPQQAPDMGPRPVPSTKPEPQRISNRQPVTPRRDGDSATAMELVKRLHATVLAEKLNVVELQEAITQALRAKVDLNTPGPDGESTAVYIAAENGHAKAVELLRRYGADIMRTGPAGVTPLFIACFKGWHDVVSIIVNWLPRDERWRATRNYEEQGVVVVRRGEIFQPHNLVKDSRGHVRGVIQGSDQDWPRTRHEEISAPPHIFEQTTERDIQLEKTEQADHSSPFFIACQEGHLDIVRTLYAAGVNVETPDQAGATPFYSACQHGNIDIVRYLFGKVNPRTGETLDAQQGVDSGETPLDAARDFNHLNIVQFLSEPYNEPIIASSVPRPEQVPRFDVDADDVESDSDDEIRLLPEKLLIDISNNVKPNIDQPIQDNSAAENVQEVTQPNQTKIKRGKTKTLDLAMRRRGSVYSAGFLVEEEDATQFDVHGEEEDETRLRLTQLTRFVLFTGIGTFAVLAHYAAGLLVLTAILSVLLIAAPAAYANADGSGNSKTGRSIPAVQMGLCIFISIFAAAAQFVPGVLVILSVLILLLLAAPASKDNGTKKYSWR